MMIELRRPTSKLYLKLLPRYLHFICRFLELYSTLIHMPYASLKLFIRISDQPEPKLYFLLDELELGGIQI